MSMSALSVSSPDQDGESDNSTVIHQSLVKYYATKTGSVPDWLEPPGSQQSNIEQYQTQNQNNYPYQQQQQQYSPGKRPSVSSTPSSSLQDIYARRGSSAEVARTTTQQYNYPQQQQYGDRGQYQQQAYGGQQQTAYGRPQNGGGAQQGNAGNDRMREKLRQLGRSQSTSAQGGQEPAWRR